MPTEAEGALDPTPEESYDVVVVGAGFGGLYALYRLRNMGLSVRVLEAAPSVGGTWYWNRYPGARCDVESVDYSYSFDDGLQRDWNWSERFSPQAEILRYLNHVADRFSLRRDIDLQTRVDAAHYAETTNRWHVRTADGRSITARHCVMATGNLTVVNRPPFPGASRYRGQILHTARWPEEGYDCTGQRIGIIGTGSSGVQLIPVVAKEAAALTVFQRTANFSMPARNRRLTAEEVEQVKQGYRERRERSRTSMAGLPVAPPPHSALEVSDEERRDTFARGWEEGGPHALLGQYNDMILDREANVFGVQYACERIREIVRDPEVAERLCPDDLPLGAKRICVDTEYYETFNRPNVDLIDVGASPIVGFTETGLETADGGRYELDVIVFATGFDAMTGALLAIDIQGRDSLPLADAWAGGPQTYLGLGVAGFPNMFIVAGPGSPSVLTNMVLAVEQHVDWIADCISHLDAAGIAAIEPSQSAQDNWVAHVTEVGSRSLRSVGNSWYRGVNIPGKPVVFMPYVAGLGPYREICDRVTAEGYTGFELSGERVTA